jgi:putative aldouronate transport system permease protein
MATSVPVSKNQLKLNKSISNTWKKIYKNWVLYLFLLPSLVYVIVLNYLPMYGIQIAFKDFRASLGIMGSPWVGLKHFKNFFGSYQFGTLLYNTLALSIYQLVATIPLPVFLALILNYTTSPKLKKVAQTSTYAPHLISVVVMAGMLTVFCSQTGLFNQITGLFGIEPVQFLGQEKMFRSIYVWSTVWQRTGFNAVIYIAALTSVSYELHEAAIVDGASKLKRVLHIDIPAIMPTMIILIIMNLGNIMGIGFEKAFLLQKDLNLGTSEIISTYVYKIGIKGAQYSYATAIGLFNNTINFILLVTVNYISKKLSNSSLW